MDNQNIYKQTKSLSVLFVEDDLQLRIRTAEILEDYFYCVDVAVDGLDALERYKHYHELKHTYYDLVISDIQMPRMDGVELTTQIYTLHADQIIVILSGHTQSDYLLALINLGVAQFITKPIDYQQMLDTLGSIASKINLAPKLAIKPSHIVTLSEEVFWDKEKSLLSSNGSDVALTKYEIHLMHLFISKFEYVCSTDEILSHFYLSDIDMSFESLRGMMMRLRKKLPTGVLVSVYGLGYRLSRI